MARNSDTDATFARRHVLRDGVRIPLGSIGSLEQRTFRVPGSVVGDSGFLKLEVVTLASRQTYATDPIPLRRGRTLEWQIESNLALSSVLIR